MVVVRVVIITVVAGTSPAGKGRRMRPDPLDQTVLRVQNLSAHGVCSGKILNSNQK